MPKLWDDTIEAHRRAVRDAILQTTAHLVSDHGLRAVTMSQIAEEAGVSRATLYKYFSDVEAILSTWHERQIADHISHLAEVRDRVGEPGKRVAAVLEAYAVISYEIHGHHNTDLATLLHGDEQVSPAQRQVHHMLQQAISEAAQVGAVRTDIAADEIATFCMQAVTAAKSLQSKSAVQRLVGMILAGIQPPASATGP